MAYESSATFFCISASTLTSKYVGIYIIINILIYIIINIIIYIIINILIYVIISTIIHKIIYTICFV